MNRNESCVINGGITTKYFLLKRGARQEDPIAAYLFIIFLEIFFKMGRENHNINKLIILDKNFLLTAYADDTTLCVSDIASVNEIIKSFNVFSKYS